MSIFKKGAELAAAAAAAKAAAQAEREQVKLANDAILVAVFERRFAALLPDLEEDAISYYADSEHELIWFRREIPLARSVTIGLLINGHWRTDEGCDYDDWPDETFILHLYQHLKL